MELRHLRYFKVVAELLNFSRAAEQLRMTQPALSRQILALEEELDERLLDRNRVSVQLTDAGRTFYSQTCKILAQVDMAVAAVHEVGEGVGGELIICNDWRMGNQLVPASLIEFRARHPRAEVTLQDKKVHDQLKLILNQRAHVGFVVRELLPKHRDLREMLLLRSPLGVLLPPAHALARRQSVRLAELADETWILFDPKEVPDYQDYLKRLCRLSGFTPRFGITAATLEGLIGRVASGYGIALMPEHIMRTSMEQVAFVLTDCSPIELCAVWHGQNKSKLLQQYLNILRRNLTLAKSKSAT